MANETQTNDPKAEPIKRFPPFLGGRPCSPADPKPIAPPAPSRSAL